MPSSTIITSGATLVSKLSIIIPAKNEAQSLEILLSKLQRNYRDAEIIVVDDGSTDNTPTVCRKAGIYLVSHPYNVGNGAAIKSGARNANGDVLVFMDSDGQHDPADIPRLLDRLHDGYDMVVGARTSSTQAGRRRKLGNNFYNRFATLITGHKIKDLTSGFRAVKADKFKEFLHLLPNGFSYPTTITMAFFRSGYSVTYVSINAGKRTGKSHLKLMRDGIRFLLIIFRIGTIYSPLKVFVPASTLVFMTGLGYYLYTYTTQGRFTNMSALLFLSSILIFLIGLISEQITNLMYSRDGR
jgi:glycosyltransferase involved in cell wall biosynthesis